MDEREEKTITSPKRLRGLTLKPEIAKKRSEGAKIDIQYNDDGEGGICTTNLILGCVSTNHGASISY